MAWRSLRHDSASPCVTTNGFGAVIWVPSSQPVDRRRLDAPDATSSPYRHPSGGGGHEAAGDHPRGGCQPGGGGGHPGGTWNLYRRSRRCETIDQTKLATASPKNTSTLTAKVAPRIIAPVRCQGGHSRGGVQHLSRTSHRQLRWLPGKSPITDSLGEYGGHIVAIVAACRMPQRGLGELRTARFSSAERWIASSQPSSLPSLRRCCPCSPWPRSSGSATPCTAPPTCPGRARSSSGVRRHCGRGDHHLVRGNEPVVVEQTSPRPPLLGNRSFRCGRHRHPTLPRGPRHAAGHGDRADRVAGDHGRCLDGSLVALRRLRAACRSLSLPVGAGDARSSAPRGDLHDTVWSRAHVGPADDRVHLGPDARLRNTCVIPSLWTSGQRHKVLPGRHPHRGHRPRAPRRIPDPDGLPRVRGSQRGGSHGQVRCPTAPTRALGHQPFLGLEPDTAQRSRRGDSRTPALGLARNREGSGPRRGTGRSGRSPQMGRPPRGEVGRLDGHGGTARIAVPPLVLACAGRGGRPGSLARCVRAIRRCVFGGLWLARARGGPARQRCGPALCPEAGHSSGLSAVRS